MTLNPKLPDEIESADASSASAEDAAAMADLLLFDGNPLDDLTIVTLPEKHLDLIMKDGMIFKNEIE